MAARKSGLGRGLDALIPVDHPSVGFAEVELSEIAPNPQQPRVRFDEETGRGSAWHDHARLALHGVRPSFSSDDVLRFQQRHSSRHREPPAAGQRPQSGSRAARAGESRKG